MNVQLKLDDASAELAEALFTHPATDTGVAICFAVSESNHPDNWTSTERDADCPMCTYIVNTKWPIPNE